VGQALVQLLQTIIIHQSLEMLASLQRKDGLFDLE